MTSLLNSAKLIPRDYQQQGIAFLQSKRHAAVWDRPGLGKTLQGVMAAHPPVLVVCPSYLMEQWANVIDTQFPEQTIAVASGDANKRISMLNSGADWTIINVEMLRQYELKRKWRTVIFDEAHHLKGRTSVQSRKALEIAKRTPYVFELTATPIKNLADDLYMQLKILDPYRFTGYDSFCKEFLEVVTTRWGSKVIGIRYQDHLRDVLLNYVIRRTYDDTGRSLPELIEQVITVEPTDEWRRHYDTLKDKYKIEFQNQAFFLTNAMQVFTLLRQLTACKEKYETLKQLLDDLDSEEDASLGKAVIFTWYKQTAEDVSKFLGIPAITGETNPKFRATIAHDSDKIVANIAALSEGIDLSDKRTCIFIEEDHTPGMHDQALSRVQRERRDSSVTPVRVFYIHMKKSVDVTIHKKRTDKTATVFELLREELNT